MVLPQLPEHHPAAVVLGLSIRPVAVNTRLSITSSMNRRGQCVFLKLQTERLAWIGKIVYRKSLKKEDHFQKLLGGDEKAAYRCMALTCLAGPPLKS